MFAGMSGTSLPDALPTSLVGSYAQPDWLIDRERLRGRFPPRVRATELWRVDPKYLEQAQDDATLLAIRDQERAGLDIVTDGEVRRESYSNRFATALDGRRYRQPGHGARPQRPPESGAARRRADRAQASRPGARRAVPPREHRPHRSRSPCPGPFTMSQQAQNDAYDERGRAGAGLRRRRATPRSRPVRRRRRHRADRRAVHAGAAREGARVRRRGAQPRARRRARHDRRPHLLRLRRDHPRASVGLLVPARAGRLPCDQISIETAQSGSTAGARGAAGQDDHPRRARPRRRRRGRVARDRRGAHPPGAAVQARRPSSSPRPTAA